MARLVSTLRFEMRGFEECKQSMQSAAEAAENGGVEWAWVDAEDGCLFAEGMKISAIHTLWEDGGCVLEIKPTASMVLWAGLLMAALPARASVKWRAGWPFFYCPPNDDRDCEDDPTPLVPNELVPA